MSRAKPDLGVLQERIGYRFRDEALLRRALTHVSAAVGPANYQRLEFLGDRVLGLVVARMLYAAFPEASEGELSRRLAELVRRESCADVALSWDLGPYITLGVGEVRSAGRRNAAILADVCEAVFGAAMLDGGYDAGAAVVGRAFAGRLETPRRPLRDAKTALQEWAQGRGRPTPLYELVQRSGPDHSPKFRIAAKVEGLEPGMGDGASKRAAEQDAARAVLLREGVWTEAGHG